MIAILAFVGALAMQQTDTTFAVQPNARLEVRNTGGEISVNSWNRAAVRVQARHGSRERLTVRSTGSVVSIGSRAERGPGGIVDYQITVPASMSVDLHGMYTDIVVEGVRGGVNARTMNGDIRVRNGQGAVSARSVQGAIRIEGVRGRVQANTVSDGIRISNVDGDVSAETVSGDIVLDRIQAGRVDGATVSGNVFYDGAIRNQGTYSFATHSGNVTVAAPPGASATVSVATLNGRLDSSFPVNVPDARQGRRFSFALGGGSARLEMETFSGNIQLRRTGEVRAPEDRQRLLGRARRSS
ncbi:hypothetical protein BH24GEM2_BH24GEM2_12930 [soil metagenome]